MQIFIKNMACESCIVLLEQTLHELGIMALKVILGEIETQNDLTKEEINSLNVKIKKFGLEIIEQKHGVLVENIKLAMVDYVYHSDEKPPVTLSVFLSERLKHNYGYMAHSFSVAEGRTIKNYLAALRVERVKELILSEVETLTQIAYRMHYCSVAHLSKHFKNITGVTITQFKALKDKSRTTIQEI